MPEPLAVQHGPAPEGAPAVLCVDDDAQLLRGLELNLRRDYQVRTASDGAAALKDLATGGEVAVVVSDMRMPGMDGATLLKAVAAHWPCTARIMLTGDPGRDAAIMAINDGHVFRYLSKPCLPQQLRAAVADGVRHWQSARTEQNVLRETLLGSVKVLVDVLGITNPAALGRATRTKRLVTDFAAKLDMPVSWELEAAAMFSQLGFLALPVQVAEKLERRESLTEGEAALVERAPTVSGRLLGHIPRLEGVLQILQAVERALPAARQLATGQRDAAALLSIVRDFEGLLSQGKAPALAFDILRLQGDRHDQAMLGRIAASHVQVEERVEVRQLPLRDVQRGMVLVDELRTESGTLLVPAGFEVNQAFLERLSHFGPRLLAGRVLVQQPTATHVAGSKLTAHEGAT